jgi:hypothetical protein
MPPRHKRQQGTPVGTSRTKCGGRRDSISIIATNGGPLHNIIVPYIRSMHSIPNQRCYLWVWAGLCLQHYYMRHFDKTEEEIKSINWAGMAIVSRKLKQPEQVFSIKLCTDHLPKGSGLEQYGFAITHCSRCQGKETVDHLFQCQVNPEHKRIFVYTRTQQLEKIRTIPAMAQALVSGVAALLMAQQRIT